MKRLALIFSLAVVLNSSALAQQPKGKAEPQAPAGEVYEKDVEFGNGGETALHLDIARPEKAEGRLPCIVVIHGGGWRGGHYKVHVPQIFEFAKQGYVSATVQYRLVPSGR